MAAPSPALDRGALASVAAGDTGWTSAPRRCRWTALVEPDRLVEGLVEG